MKKVILLMLMLALAGFAGVTSASAAGAQEGTGLLSQCDVVGDFTYTGTVLDCLESGSGLTLLTGDEEAPVEVTVYGIGPSRYWESLGVDRPTVGETITVDGYIVDCSGIERFLLSSVTIPGVEEDPADDIVIELRDSETGKPLWRSLGRTGDGTYGPAYGQDGEMGEYGPGYGKNSEDTGHYGPGYGNEGGSSSGNGGKGGK